MKKNFLFFLLFAYVELWSTPLDTFNKILKETNINQIKYKYIIFDNLENNQTQQEAKKLFEQILPYYLKTQTLFSEERLERLKHEQIIIDVKDKDSTIPKTVRKFNEIEKNYYKNLTTRDIPYYDIFFKMLNGYLKNIQRDDTLAKKALDDIVQLTKNSKASIDYMYGLSILDKLYKVVKRKEILEEYPPPNKELLYQKIEQDKSNTIEQFRVPRYKDRLTKEENEKNIKRASLIIDDIEKKLNLYTKKYIEVLKNGSKKELEQLKTYQQEEKKRLNSGKVKNKVEAYLILIKNSFSNIDKVLFIQQFQNKIDKTYNEKLEELDLKK